MNDNRHNLLMLNATMSDKPLILAAKRLGYHVITTGNRPSYPGHLFSSEYVFGDYSNLSEMIAIARARDIEAICCGTSDNTAITAALLGQALGLKGHDSPNVARTMHRKDAFKNFARECDISSPVAACFAEQDEALRYAADASFPVMVKPFDAAGGKGSDRADNVAEYMSSVARAFEYSGAGIVVEPFIDGNQYTFLTFLVEGKVRAYCTWSDHSYLFPYMVSGGVLPADVPEEINQRMIAEMEKIAKAANLVDGVLNAQYILAEGIPWIIEVMRRPPGNWDTSLVSTATGVDWNEWIIKAEAGLDCSDMPCVSRTNGYYGYASLLAPRKGVFAGIRLSECLNDNIMLCEVWKPLGTEISDITYDKLGLVQLKFSSQDEAERKMEKIYELIDIEMR